MEAVAEQAVVGPVGRPGADGRDRQVVDAEHDDREDREGENPVGDDPVDLIRDRELAGALLVVAVL